MLIGCERCSLFNPSHGFASILLLKTIASNSSEDLFLCDVRRLPVAGNHPDRLNEVHTRIRERVATNAQLDAVYEVNEGNFHRKQGLKNPYPLVKFGRPMADS